MSYLMFLEIRKLKELKGNFYFVWWHISQIFFSSERNTGVTSSKPRVTNSNPRVTSSNPRDTRLKVRVARLKAQVGRLKGLVEAINHHKLNSKHSS